MSQIMKTFLGIYLLFFVLFTSVSILFLFLQVTDAQNSHARIIEEVENANFYHDVLKECFDNAQSNGYQLRMVLYRENNLEIICEQPEDIPEEVNDITKARIELDFHFEVPFFGIEEEHTMAGYAH